MKQYINNKLVDLTPEEKTIREEERKKYQEYKTTPREVFVTNYDEDDTCLTCSA